MQKTLAEIAKIVGGEVVGDENLIIQGLSGIQEAKEGDLTFVANSKYIPLIKKTKASAIITPRDMDVPDKSIIRTNNPSLAFANVASVIVKRDEYRTKGIHKTACIAEDAKIGKGVGIGPYAIIEKDAQVGDNTVIEGGCYIGYQTEIGSGCTLYPNVTIRERIKIGDRVIIHSGTVIGSDGFGFAQAEGIHEKIPQIGIVVIEDDVEIGANVAIDRARFDKTIIGRGTKIDNLVQIAHNVVVGENCIIVSQVGISGSVIIKKGAILAGQAGVVGHLTIGENVVVAAKAGVTKSIADNEKVSDYPAKPHALAKRIHGYVQRLPIYVKTIKELKRKIEQLEDKLYGKSKAKNS